MKAFDIRVQIQTLLGVKMDGNLGSKSLAAFEQLAGMPADAPWPPTGGAGFDGQATPALLEEYKRLYSEMIIRDGWAEKAAAVAGKIVENYLRYARVADLLWGRHQGDTLAPWGGGQIWHFIGIVHQLEGSGDFGTHLHNGDSLQRPTVNEPKGRPIGRGPFSWEESALDALMIKGLNNEPDWSLPRMLYHLERYNGPGYRRYHPEVLTPYLWSGSMHYRVGKYVADKKFDPEAVSKQVGAALVLHALGYR